jgi:hypothetical protein
MTFFSFATTTPSAAAPRITRTGLRFTKRVVRPGNALNVASFDRVFLATALADRLEVTRFFCFALMRWHNSHDRANSLTLVSSRLTNPDATVR